MIAFLPIRTVSESNQHTHWRARSHRAKAQRSSAFYGLLSTWGRCLYRTRPCIVTLTRVAPRDLDQGNLEASLKAVQDGVADWLEGEYGEGQDRQPGLTWHYAQRRGGPREYAVEITVTSEQGHNHGTSSRYP